MAGKGTRLSLNGVEKQYADVVALHPTDLDIHAGEFFSLIGPSGSGKTTLLGTIAGFTAPSGGTIEAGGVSIASLPPYERNVGMVFQNYALFPHMTVFENIAFPLRLRRVPANEIAKQVESMLETIRLPDIRDRMPNQLSGGQQQRVALARAAIYGPNVLLMDEPLGALDKNLREQMQYEIKEFHRQINATVLYVTHDQDEAAAMSDRLGIMNGGRIVQHGTPRELYEMPRNAFVAQFLGSANFFEVSGKPTGNGECIKVPISGGRVLKAINPAGVAVAPNSAVICVRPESISLEKEVAKASHDDLNRIEGRVVDAVYTAGTFRYGVETTMGETVVVRMPSVRKMEMLAPGEKVSLGWPANSTLVIQKD